MGHADDESIIADAEVVNELLDEATASGNWRLVREARVIVGWITQGIRERTVKLPAPDLLHPSDEFPPAA